MEYDIYQKEGTGEAVDPQGWTEGSQGDLASPLHFSPVPPLCISFKIQTSIMKHGRKGMI